jgi:hypothetical protein
MGKMRNVFNAFHGNDLTEIDLTIPPEKEYEIKAKLHIKYVYFETGGWHKEERGKKITLMSPALTVDTAKRMAHECPDYVEINVDGIHLVGSCGAIYHGTLMLPAKAYEALRKMVKEADEKIKDTR